MEKKWDTVIPADVKRLFVKWDIYVPLVTKGLTYPSPCYHPDLLYKLPNATDLPPL